MTSWSRFWQGSAKSVKYESFQMLKNSYNIIDKSLTNFYYSENLRKYHRIPQIFHMGHGEHRPRVVCPFVSTTKHFLHFWKRRVWRWDDIIGVPIKNSSRDNLSQAVPYKFIECVYNPPSSIKFEHFEPKRAKIKHPWDMFETCGFHWWFLSILLYRSSCGRESL